MLFILLLGMGAISLATVSGFFSVWGLAHTFHGIFASVVAMGIAIEYGKLIGISFLYRFWGKVSTTLKYWLFGPMIITTFIVMLVTAMGHYGYLSSGYQADVLPLKQLTEQVKLLDEEKLRKIERKKEIDQQISQLPQDYVKGRERLIRQFKAEQQEVTNRINDLDKQILSLKTETLKTETHVGPIIYIAKAFGLDTDEATNYLVLLIICVFDPMAILLTIATNVAIRERERELSNKSVITKEPVFPLPDTEVISEPIYQEPISEDDIPAVVDEPITETTEPNEDPMTILDRGYPPSIRQLQGALDELNTRKTLTAEEEKVKTRIDQILHQYSAQNNFFRNNSALKTK
jgi:hypothetical protein